MVEQAKELDWLLNEEYVPSSVERKKALLMYVLVGIIVALSKESVSVYEFFHLKQALGWRTLFFMSLVVWVFLIFVPYVWVVPVVVFLVFMAIWWIFCKQAREWEFVIDHNKILLPFFAWFGEWILSIFDLDLEDSGPSGKAVTKTPENSA